MRPCSLALLFLPLAAAAEYRAGVSRIDITPAAGHIMGGYSERKLPATGTHDPLYATVLVIESGENSLALVTCDLRSFVSTRVGELARQKFGIKNTIISVSHTHSGPLTWEARTPWYTEAEDKMVEAIEKRKLQRFRHLWQFRAATSTWVSTGAKSWMAGRRCGGEMRRG